MSLTLQPRLKPFLGRSEIWEALKFYKKSIHIYEKRFAEEFECQYGVMFSYGRSALYALFKVWELEGAEIICPAYTCVVVPHAIVLSGNIPVFVDCEPGSFNMSYEGITNSINANTRAIIVTHLFGYPMDVERIDQIVKDKERVFGHKIYIVQDVAHSYGARSAGKMVTGSGDAAIFGCNISKIITSIFGGMVTMNSSETYQKLVDYKAQNSRRIVFKPLKRLVYLIAIYIAFNPYIYWLVNQLEKKGWIDQFTKYYDEGTIEFPSDWDGKPCDIEARVGLIQLKKYGEIVKARSENARAWETFLHDKKVEFLDEVRGSTFSHCVGLVRNRNEWLSSYRKRGIQLGILIEYCIPSMEAYKKYSQNKSFPIAEYYSQHTINFPLRNHPGIYQNS